MRLLFTVLSSPLFINKNFRDFSSEVNYWATNPDLAIPCGYTIARFRANQSVRCPHDQELSPTSRSYRVQADSESQHILWLISISYCKPPILSFPPDNQTESRLWPDVSPSSDTFHTDTDSEDLSLKNLGYVPFVKASWNQEQTPTPVSMFNCFEPSTQTQILKTSPWNI